MKKARYLRAISAMLCVIMVMLCIPLSAVAVENAEIYDDPSSSSPSSGENISTESL